MANDVLYLKCAVCGERMPVFGLAAVVPLAGGVRWLPCTFPNGRRRHGLETWAARHATKHHRQRAGLPTASEMFSLETDKEATDGTETPTG